MNLGLKDKTALVTGCSKGIGKAIAVAFAKESTNVVICGRGEEALKEAAAEIEKLGGNVLAVQADLTKQSDVEHLVSSAIDRFK
ncbi:SDR family NAD(P)-dependent oxidoreductase [Neobacillus sp. BF23-41]|uniref:SDR family NAD(P)-dependent oxidoreductase n=1 Tax=Neobacillus sp. BF23-41 TaxID=3240280 RepID=UPI0034E46E06